MNVVESLIDAILLRKIDLVARMLSLGADANQHDRDGTPALWLAASSGQLDVVQALLDSAASVDAREPKYGMTPLMIACGNGHGKVVEALLKTGADPNARDLTDETPLMFAAKAGVVSAVRQLLASGAEPLAKDKTLRTALHWAIERGDFPHVISILVSQGLDPQAKDCYGKAPFAEARRKGFQESLFVLSRGSSAS